jgi:hypothetical protein
MSFIMASGLSLPWRRWFSAGLVVRFEAVETGRRWLEVEDSLPLRFKEKYLAKPVFEPPASPGARKVTPGGRESSGKGDRLAVRNVCTDSKEVLISDDVSSARTKVRCRGRVIRILCFNSSRVVRLSFRFTIDDSWSMPRFRMALSYLTAS